MPLYDSTTLSTLRKRRYCMLGIFALQRRNSTAQIKGNLSYFSSGSFLVQDEKWPRRAEAKTRLTCERVSSEIILHNCYTMLFCLGCIFSVLS